MDHPINWLESLPPPCVCALLILSPSLRLIARSLHRFTVAPLFADGHLAATGTTWLFGRRVEVLRATAVGVVPYTKGWSVGGVFCVRFLSMRSPWRCGSPPASSPQSGDTQTKAPWWLEIVCKCVRLFFKPVINWRSARDEPRLLPHQLGKVFFWGFLYSHPSSG